MTRAPHYIHGTDPLEQTRLSLLNDLINQRVLPELAPRPGERALDVGSGLGQMARAIARAVAPTGSVLAIERDPDQLATARLLALAAPEDAPVEFRQGDATDLPLRPDEERSFDLVHCRFVLEHLPDPLAAVRQMARAARPGARAFLADDDHALLTLHPPAPAFMRTWEAYWRAYHCAGNDPRVGTRLVTLLHHAGFAPSRTGMIFFGACRPEPAFEPLVRNLAEVTRTGRALATSHQLTDPTTFDAGIDDLMAWAARPDAALWYPLCWAEGIRTR